jgi:hypothetical protein
MTSKIDELQKNDPYALQKINRSIEDFMSQCSDPEIEVYATARLLEHNMLSIDTLKKAFKLKDEWAKEKAKEESIAKAKAEERERQRKTMDNMFYKKYNEKVGVPQYLDSRPIEEIGAYLKELESRPLHFSSLFSASVLEVTEFLDRYIEKRRNTPDIQTLGNFTQKIGEIKGDLKELGDKILGHDAKKNESKSYVT